MYNLLEYISNYSNPTANFNVDIENSDSFKSFKYKVKLLGNTFADRANGISRNTTVPVSLAIN